MKKHFLILLMLGAAVGCWAQGPNDSGEYYKAADGKKGAALKTALCGIIYDRDEEGADLNAAYKALSRRRGCRPECGL